MPDGILKAPLRYVDVVVWLQAQMLYDNCLRRILWFEIQGSNAANSFIWIILWTCLPWVPYARCHSGCSGVAPLSLVVSVSGKNSPGSEGMQGRRRWWSEGLLLMFSTSWVIAMDCYVIIALCYVLRLGCCAMMKWGVANRWDCQYRPSSGWKKNPKGKYNKLIIYQSLKKLPSTELQSTFSSSITSKESQIICCFQTVSLNIRQKKKVTQKSEQKVSKTSE